LSEDFTLHAFVQEIDPSIDLDSIPVIGKSLELANTRLSRATIQIMNDNGLSIPAFDIELTWGPQNIGQFQAQSSQLLLSWRNVPFRTPADGDTDNLSASHWSVQWEGYVFADWFLSAQLQYTTATETTPRRLLLSGEILDTSRRRQVSDIVNRLTATNGSVKNQVWEASMAPAINSKFTLDRLFLSARIGGTDAYAVAGQASWGVGGVGSAVLLFEKGAEAEVSSDFTFTVGVENLQMSDIFDSALARGVEANLVGENPTVVQIVI
jgi:hypothetical protein